MAKSVDVSTKDIRAWARRTKADVKGDRTEWAQAFRQVLFILQSCCQNAEDGKGFKDNDEIWHEKQRRMVGGRLISRTRPYSWSG